MIYSMSIPIAKVLKRKQIWTWIWLCWTFLIIYLSITSIPTIVIPTLIGIDKIGHIVFYGLHTFWGFLSIENDFRPLSNNKNWVKIFVSAIFALFLGLVLELYQSTLAHRIFDYYDLLANIIGVILTVFLIVVLTNRPLKN